MKTQIFIILFLCLSLSACKAKIDSKTTQKKSVNKTAGQIPKQKLNDVGSAVKNIKVSTEKSVTANVENQMDQTVQSGKSEDLKAWKEKVEKDLKPVPLKPQSTIAISSTAKKEITTAKNVKKKELVMADKTSKMKSKETTKRLELSNNNFGKAQKAEYKEIK